MNLWFYIEYISFLELTNPSLTLFANMDLSAMTKLSELHKLEMTPMYVIPQYLICSEKVHKRIRNL